MTSVPRTCGLLNREYTCYVNVVLQVLARSPDVVRWAQEYTHEGEGPAEDCIRCILRDTILEMRKVPSPAPFIPQDLLNWIRQKTQAFVAGVQADSEEVLIFLMRQSGLDFFKHEETEKLLRNVDGHLEEQISTAPTIGLGTYHVLAVGQPESTSTQKLLDDYISVRNSRTCRAGDGRVCTERNFSILPKMLMMKLNRFTYVNNKWIKNRKPCTMDSQVSIMNIHNENITYNICGYINHVGATPSVGHYKANVIDFGEWFSYSDDHVVRKTLTTKDTYLVFYKQASTEEVPEELLQYNQDVVFSEQDLQSDDELMEGVQTITSADECWWKKNLSYKEHKRVKHGENPYTCKRTDCGEIFSNYESFRIHTLAHLDVKFTCDYPNCGASYKLLPSLKTHKRLKHKDNQYTCDNINCGETFSTYENFRTHQLKHLEKTYTCDYPNCGRTYNRLGELKEHKRVNHGETTYKCNRPDCDETFARYRSLVSHNLMHQGESFKCDFPNCGKLYQGLSALNRHKREKHDGKPFSCDRPDCDETFARCQDLAAHKLTHVDVTYACDYPTCRRTYGRLRSLEAHQLLKHRENPYTCKRTDCGEIFSNYESFRIHTLAHLDVTYTCDYPNCGRTYERAYNLTKHKRDKHNDKPFSCGRPDCDETFARYPDLAAHKLTHLDVTYTCDYPNCRRTYGRLRSLKIHKNAAHRATKNLDGNDCATLLNKQRYANIIGDPGFVLLCDVKNSKEFEDFQNRKHQ